jgi:Bacterial Ig-like domain (group 2)
MRPAFSTQLAPYALLAATALIAGCDTSPTGLDREQPFLLVVQPSSATLLTGRQLQLRVMAKGAEDRVSSERDVHWSSTDDRIATVSPAGVVTATGLGQAQIDVLWEGHRAFATVKVIDRDIIPPCPSFAIEGLKPSAEKVSQCAAESGGGEN